MEQNSKIAGEPEFTGVSYLRQGADGLGEPKEKQIYGMTH